MASRWFAVAIVAVIATFAAMCYPYRFAPAHGAWLGLESVEVLIVAGNILLFLPVGVAEGCLAQLLWGRRLWLLPIVAADVAFLSVVGETVQLWLPSRDSSIVDLLANTVGGVLGAFVGPGLCLPRSA